MSTTGLIVLCVAALAVVAVTVLLVFLIMAVRSLRRERSELATRLDDLAQQIVAREVARAPQVAESTVAEFVITDIGNPAPAREPNVADRVVLSATLGEPLVKAAAFGHGLRRALAPETRNRIFFEMRREVRRTRKERRREMRQAWRESRMRRDAA